LEVVAVTGSFQLGKIQVKIDKAMRLAQGNDIKIRFIKKQPLPVQVDGEPWLQDPCEIRIRHIGRARVLCAESESLHIQDSEEGEEPFRYPELAGSLF
jgi:diacylglycerol kinase (ATP)